MLLFKLFGLADLFTAVIMILLQLDLVGWRLPVSCALYLIIKGLIFRGDIASMIDMVVAVYILIMLLLGIWFITILCVVYLVIKGIMSLA